MMVRTQFAVVRLNDKYFLAHLAEIFHRFIVPD
jgi:hypothetical protein